MAIKSPSAVPVFLFLALVLVFTPCAAIILVWFKRRHQRRRARNSPIDVPNALTEWSKPSAHSIEMADFHAPPPPPPPPPAPPIPTPPSASIPPIRSMSTSRTNRPLRNLPSPLTFSNSNTAPTNTHANPFTDTPYQSSSSSFNTQPSTYAHQPYVSPSSPRDTNPFHDAHSSSPSPRVYSLRTALESEPSPSRVRLGGERRPSWTDAPRVKSQKVRPETVVTNGSAAGSAATGSEEERFVYHEVPKVPRMPDAWVG